VYIHTHSTPFETSVVSLQIPDAPFKSTIASPAIATPTSQPAKRGRKRASKLPSFDLQDLLCYSYFKQEDLSEFKCDACKQISDATVRQVHTHTHIKYAHTHLHTTRTHIHIDTHSRIHLHTLSLAHTLSQAIAIPANRYLILHVVRTKFDAKSFRPTKVSQRACIYIYICVCV
jgi:hypothetical protein